MKIKRAGFTLAEVLIVLTILGVVAALTIPTIIANKDKQTYVSQLKKMYSSLENGRKLASIDEGGDISELFSITKSSKDTFDALTRQFKVAKYCGDASGCWYDGMKYLDGSLYNGDGLFETYYDGHEGKGILADGSLIMVSSNHDSCTDSSDYTAYSPPAYRYKCGEIYVDVNGKKAPNIIGRDVFRFDVTRDGVYPHGLKYSDADIKSDCSSSGDGSRCAARVIKEDAMNY